MYQITGYFGFANPPAHNLTEEMKEYIKSMPRESNPTNSAIGEQGFKVSPNPSNGKFQVEFNAKISGNLEIIDAKGSKIANKTVVNEKLVDIDLSDKASGIYFIQMSADNKTYSQKIIKQ